MARVERVVPLLFQLVKGATTDISENQWLQLRELQGAALSRVVQLEHHTIEVSRVLQARRISHAFLKGSATAHLDYPSPEWREFSDIDVLISPSSRVAVLRALADEGWTQGYALPRHHEDFTHAITLVKSGMELDLHQRIAHRALGLLAPTSDLLDRRRSFSVPGTDMPALSDTDRLIHAALHSATSGIPKRRRLSSLADVLVIAESRPSIAAEVLDRSARWRLWPVVREEIRIAYRTARIETPDPWRAALQERPRHRDRLVDAAYLAPYRRPVLEEFAYLRLLEGWRSRARYVRGYLATDPDYAEQHGRNGPMAQARYLLRKMRSRAR